MQFQPHLSSFQSHVAIAVIAVLGWVFVIIPVWRFSRARFLSTDTLNRVRTAFLQPVIDLQWLRHPRTKWVISALAGIGIFALGLWIGWHRELVSARIPQLSHKAIGKVSASSSPVETERPSVSPAVATPEPALILSAPAYSTADHLLKEKEANAARLVQPAARANETPAPLTAVTPSAKQTPKSVQRHAPAPAPLMTLEALIAVATSAPLPEYPYQAKQAGITGSGICKLVVDTRNGTVTSATMAQSTGNAILDKAATNAFRQWRFKPGTVALVKVPITYE